MGRRFNATNANTIAPGKRSDEAFISEQNQNSFAPFADTIMTNNSKSPNNVDLFIRFNDSNTNAMFLGEGQTIVVDIPFRFLTAENLDGSKTLQVKGFRFTTESKF